MKKLLYILMSAILIFSTAACGQTPDNTSIKVSETAQNTAVPTGPANEADESNILIAYFSWFGNTAEMASYIQEQTGGVLFEIVPVNQYPEDYDECGYVAL